MLVRQPGGAAGAVRDDLVCLTDVTATLLAASGHGVPEYMDARPLPGLGLAGDSPRDMLVGGLQSGWMAYDGRHKLVKYGNGAAGLFDLQEDPQEQHNLAESAAHAADIPPLGRCALARGVMRSVQASHSYNLVDASESGPLWANKVFGAAGWERVYPHSLDQ